MEKGQYFEVSLSWDWLFYLQLYNIYIKGFIYLQSSIFDGFDVHIYTYIYYIMLYIYINYGRHHA